MKKGKCVWNMRNFTKKNNLGNEVIENSFIKILFTIASILIVLSVLKYDKLISNIFYVSFFITLAFWIYKLFINRLSVIDYLSFIIIILSILNVFINSSLTSVTLSFNYIKKVIMFATCIMFLDTMTKINLNSHTKEYILCVNFFVSIVMIILYFANGNSMYMFNGIVTKYLTFSFSNPNTASLYLFSIAIYLLLFLKYYQNFLLKLISLVIFMFFIYFIYETGSRNALFAIIISVVLFVVITFKKNDSVIKVPTIVKIFVVVWPIIFVFIYLKVVDSEFIGETFSFLVSKGKDLNSREKMWIFALENYNKSPIFGAYAQISDGTGLGQMHNSHLDALCSYGIIPFIVLLLYLYLIIKKIGLNTSDKESALTTIFFMSFIFLGVGEAILFSGGLGFYILCGTMIGFSKKII